MYVDFHLHEQCVLFRLDAGGLVDHRIGAQVEGFVGQEARRPGKSRTMIPWMGTVGNQHGITQKQKVDDKQGSFHGDCGNNMVIHLAQLGWISLAKL